MRLWERVRREIVQEMLKFQHGAYIEFEDVRGTPRQLTASHLRAVRNSLVGEAVTATRALAASDSGSVLFLAAVAGFVTTLPAPALGLNFKFIVKTAPTSNGYLIKSLSDTNIIVVSVNELETDTTEDGPSDDNADVVTLVANLASKGDYLDFYCDGTNWYCIGQTVLDGAVTSATT